MTHEQRMEYFENALDWRIGRVVPSSSGDPNNNYRDHEIIMAMEITSV